MQTLLQTRYQIEADTFTAKIADKNLSTRLQQLFEDLKVYLSMDESASFTEPKDPREMTRRIHGIKDEIGDLAVHIHSLQNPGTFLEWINYLVDCFRSIFGDTKETIANDIKTNKETVLEKYEAILPLLREATMDKKTLAYLNKQQANCNQIKDSLIRDLNKNTSLANRLSHPLESCNKDLKKVSAALVKFLNASTEENRAALKQALSAHQGYSESGEVFLEVVNRALQEAHQMYGDILPGPTQTLDVDSAPLAGSDSGANRGRYDGWEDSDDDEEGPRPP